MNAKHFWAHGKASLPILAASLAAKLQKLPKIPQNALKGRVFLTFHLSKYHHTVMRSIKVNVVFGPP
jgi:hypothetical protein